MAGHAAPVGRRMTTHPGSLPEHQHELVVDPDRPRAAPVTEVDPELVDPPLVGDGATDPAAGGAPPDEPWYDHGDDGGGGEPIRPARRTYGSLPLAARLAAWVGGLALLWLLLGAVLPSGAPLGVVLSGAIIGSATGLTAVGLILIWRANRVINFANGAMAGVAGLTAVHLFVSWGWPYWTTLITAPLLGLVVGALVEVLIIRRFTNAPRLVLTVATIGLAQLLGGIELLIPSRVFDAPGMVLGAFETPLNTVEFEVGAVLINGNHLLTLAVVPVVVAVLAWFLRRSLAGTAIRAASENTDRARLLGVPVRNLTTAVWAIAGALAALTFVLQAPFQGAAPSAAAGPAILLPALAAAIVARMESLPVAFGAAIGLGVMQQLVRWNTDTPSLVDVAILVVILVALLVGERNRSRAHDADGGWRNADLIRSLAPAVAALPVVRWAKRAGVVLLVLGAVLLPLRLGPSDAFSMSIMAVWAIVAVSLVVLTGWAGQISLGQFAIVGAGAIVAGNMVSRWNIDLFLVLAVATATGALVAVLLGVPALRIKGPFLAVVTLAFAVVLDGYVLNPNVFPELIPQTVTRPLLWGRVDLEDERSMLWFTLACLAVCILVARSVRRSRSGRLLIAARDNRKATEAASVSARWATLQGFIFSGALAGLAGGLHVLLLHGAREGSYQVVQSVEVFSGATIGGLGSLGGAIVGAAGLRGAQDLDATIRLVGAGVGVLVVLWAVPAGLAGLAARLRDRIVRPIARRAGLDLEGQPLADPAAADAHDDSTGAAAQDQEEPSGTAHHHGGGEPEPVPPPFLGTVDRPLWDRPEPLLRAGDVDVSYGQLQVLFGVDLDVHDGEVVALLGTNGAGKSTLLKAVCGLSGSSGDITLDGRRISGRSPEQIVRDGVALMPGGKAVFPTLSVTDHLRLACWTFRKDGDRIDEDMAEVHRLFPILEERRTQLAGDLSGGEQQQLALAMTLLLRPRVLLIDELSLGLSPLIVAALCDVVRTLNEGGMTIVVVEQSVNVALTLAERAVFMEKGTVRFEGPTRELLERPDLLRSVFIEGAGAAEGAADSPSDPADEVLAAIDLTALDGPGPLGAPADADAEDDPAERPTVLRCRDVTKRFGGVQALSHVDLTVHAGEIVGLIGQNGAGKTTLMDCVSGFHRIDADDRDGGEIVFRGVDVTAWTPAERARSGMGRTFQEARLFPSLTVTETLAVACERGVGSRSMVADATRQPASYLAEDDTMARVRELTRMLGLERYAHTPTSVLSTGTRRIVELGCLLAEDPVLMLLDEPSAGVAQRETEALGPLLRRIRDHTGAAMLVIEHDMPLLSGLCDRLVAMELGSVVVDGAPAEVLEHPAVVASYLGTDAAAINRSGAVLG
ncbi:ATP-binding cassette domain-containing protein [Dermatobacter hominis]|uniref:ATP-binding cassette domain-containing protein n=1 Tax=Dermatobacter hominis TaxID=2884263 RepID=UPI001D1066DD|nr:ATP-binding cassette domain-containing protein [Dermatobacter hominis]UDY37853.1 ATP-binding cassette domain-containing protein [Dermatobacter hominis]